MNGLLVLAKHLLMCHKRYLIQVKGSKGSGGWGHKGRPGKHGGSKAGSGGLDKIGAKSGSSISERKKLAGKKKPEVSKPAKDTAKKGKKHGMPSQLSSPEFGMKQKDYDQVAKKLGDDWGQNALDAYEFKSGNLKAIPTNIAVDSDNVVTIYGDIHDNKGKRVGTFTRYIDSNTKSVEHSHFELDKSAQGGGFGSDFYQNNEKAYSKMGLKEIQLQANESVGGYAWARMGVDFNNSADRNAQISEFNASWKSRYPGTKPPNVNSASELAAAKGPDGTKIGKEIMLGSDWEGTKSLDPTSESFQTGQAYYEARAKRKKVKLKQSNPSNESDKNGFWGPDEADDEWHAAMQGLLHK